ncbi:unnamed protein product (macronuclear) [Paramecium tetraurelia]|uniref:Uncharacterized protein n=1 Tax=Paramecium tetraurelia TaxID=5888 RepID=A0DIN1_PARTE|nr:uncharacterized protein GSPATT00017255001 [Paramecium tetraurelia]CAK82898.1 unnamed protein product [Paramecium tetraurelia]|eukprot:XP_001450295.1 hypothetical protein (macronuclear) [Paramecium tetraurelia strain d4-2]
MISIKVISPKLKNAKHKANLSQPSITKYNNLNSFNDYFRSQRIYEKGSRHNNRISISNSRCKTDSRLFENYSSSTKRMSMQSSTLCLSNTKSQSTSPKAINLSSTMNLKSQKNVTQQSPKKQKHKQNSIQPNPLSYDFQIKFDALLLKTKSLIQHFKQREKKFIKREKDLNQEILKLKTRIEIQNRLLISYNIPQSKF